jgi:putative oxidoreductase
VPCLRVKRNCCIRDSPGFTRRCYPSPHFCAHCGRRYVLDLVSTKFKLGADAVAANVFTKNGIEPALMWAYVVMFLESVGGVCLIIGLFTRFIAAALAIEMLVALLFVHLPKGYAAGGGGYEYVLLIGAVCFIIAIRGGGPYSVDHVIGKEL